MNPKFKKNFTMTFEWFFTTVIHKIQEKLKKKFWGYPKFFSPENRKKTYYKKKERKKKFSVL